VLALLQQVPGPIIVETVRQPPITQEITMGEVVLGAAGLVGWVMIAAAVAGLLVGLVVVLIKRSRDRAAGPTDPGHAKLREVGDRQ
jgi:hypothetical protein